MRSPRLTRRNIVQGGAALGMASALPTLGSATARAQQNNVPRLRVTDDIEHLDPFDQIGGVEESIKSGVLVTLIRRTSMSGTDWEPYAASKIEQVDPTTVKFTLRDDLAWTNGFGPVTTADVKYSFERIADPKASSPWQYTWEQLDHVEVVDDLNGIIHLKAPFAPLFSSTLPWYGGQIVCKKAVVADGGHFTTKFPAQCGPFLMTGWQPKTSITLGRNAAWKGTKPAFDGYQLMIVSDDKAAELAFDAGELDYTQVSPDSIPRLEASRPKGAKLLQMPSINYTWLGMNTDYPKLKDIRVRQAIQYTIDVEQIMQGAYAGAAKPSTGIQAPGTIGYRPHKLIEHPDLKKAKALLKAAGVSHLKLTLSCLNDSLSTTTAQIIQSQLAQVGIDVEIKSYDSGVYWNLGVEKEGNDWKNLQLTLMSYGGGIDPSENLVWFTPAQIGVWNWERWNSPEFGKLYKEGLTELDPAKRSKIYQKMQDLMEQSGAYVFLTNGTVAALYRDWMEPFINPDTTLALPMFRRA